MPPTRRASSALRRCRSSGTASTAAAGGRARRRRGRRSCRRAPPSFAASRSLSAHLEQFALSARRSRGRRSSPRSPSTASSRGTPLIWVRSPNRKLTAPGLDVAVAGQQHERHLLVGVVDDLLGHPVVAGVDLDPDPARLQLRGNALPDSRRARRRPGCRPPAPAPATPGTRPRSAR